MGVKLMKCDGMETKHIGSHVLQSMTCHNLWLKLHVRHVHKRSIAFGFLVAPGLPNFTGVKLMKCDGMETKHIGSHVLQSMTCHNLWLKLHVRHVHKRSIAFGFLVAPGLPNFTI